DPALFQVADGAPADVVLADVVDLDRAHHPDLGAALFQRVLHGQRVDHGGEHAHLVAGDPVHAAGGQPRAAEDVAAADHHADLGPGLLGLDDLAGQAVDDLGVDAVVLVAHQRLAGQLEQDAAVGEVRHEGIPGIKTAEILAQSGPCRPFPGALGSRDGGAVGIFLAVRLNPGK